MPPRAYWKGHVRLLLVSFPVQLVPAIDAMERVTFHRVHKLVASKLEGCKPGETGEEGAPNVINLMEALKRSLKGSPDGGSSPPAEKPPAAAKKQRAAPAQKPAADSASRRKSSA